MKKAEETFIKECGDKWPKAFQAATFFVSQDQRFTGIAKMREPIIYAACYRGLGRDDLVPTKLTTIEIKASEQSSGLVGEIEGLINAAAKRVREVVKAAE